MNLNQFCNTHYETAQGFAVHFLPGQFENVDDVVQVAFFNICQQWDPAKHGTWEERTLIAWLYVIIYHDCIDHIRKVQRYQGVFYSSDFMDEWVAAPDQMERNLELQELFALTWVQLNEVNKESLHSLFEGDKPRDMPEPGAYRRRRWVARKAFREIWQEVAA